jgi:small-conductance mechanosensitive channel
MLMMRLLITFFIGVAATLAWQSYGDAARAMIANSSPQLSWLAPQAAVAKTARDTIAPTTSSSDPQELKAMSADLAAVRQKVDQLTAGQENMASDFTTKLQAAEQDILDKISALSQQPAAAPARKPVTPPSQAAPGR